MMVPVWIASIFAAVAAVASAKLLMKRW